MALVKDFSDTDNKNKFYTKNEAKKESKSSTKITKNFKHIR